MKIIRNRRKIIETRYAREFEFAESPEAGFSFPCNEAGEVQDLPPAAAENYCACVEGRFNVIDKGVIKYEHTYTEPAVGLCACGRKVTLESFTNTCECGRDYDISGQLLAPREQWGEETSEAASEILNKTGV